MAVQSTYSDTLRAGVAGQVVNTVPATFISRTVEGASGLAFGVAVAQGTADKGCDPFGSGDTAILGISVRERSIDANEPDKFDQYDDARIMTKGCIWVTASVAVNAGDPVYVIPATGAFAKTSASSAVQIVGARWDTSADAAAIAQVRLG
jgi:hypothetical protein